MIDIRYDLRRTTLTQVRQQFGTQPVNKAMRWALDATTRKAATHISRDIRGTYAVTAGLVRAHLKVKRLERDAKRALLYTGQRLPLETFGPRPKTVRVTATSSRGKRFKTRRRGVTAKVRKDQGRRLVAGGWLARGHILRRRWQDDNHADPFIQYGPSIPGMVAHPDTIHRAQDLVREEFPREFANRLEYILGKDSA